MSPGVFDAGRAERLRERINQDGAFHQVSQDMTLNLALETDILGAAAEIPDHAWCRQRRHEGGEYADFHVDVPSVRPFPSG